MKVIAQELKKLFRPCCLLAFLVLLVALWRAIPESQQQVCERMHTQNYPEQFTIYDNCSVDLLFNDFLLETYGDTLTADDLPELRRRHAELLDQVDRAVPNDEILQRIGQTFDRETESFSGFEVLPGEELPDLGFTEEEQIYEWSCINGQTRLAGTDHPIGFLFLFREVIYTVEQFGVYHVCAPSLINAIGDNLIIVTFFSVAALALVVIYGTAETRSRTNVLAYTSRIGRRIDRRKLLSAAIAGAITVAVGVAVTAILFSFWDVQRYYGCEIDSAMRDIRCLQWKFSDTPLSLLLAPQGQGFGGISFGALYLTQLAMLFLVGASGCTLGAVISLRCRHTITAAVCCAPIAVGELLFAFHYVLLYFVFDQYTVSVPLWESYLVAVIFAAAVALIAALDCHRKETRAL